MNKNMGSLDRVLRTIVAAVAVIVALLVGAGSVAGIVLLALAVVLLATSAVGLCPLYAVLRLDSRGRRALAR